MSSEPESRELFHLFGGSPLDRLLSFLGFGGGSREKMHRRILFWTAITWLPLLILAIIAQLTSLNPPEVPFEKDFAVHVRFLIALPLLIAAENHVHRFVSQVIPLFQERQLIPAECLPRLIEGKTRIETLKNSISSEVGLLFLALLIHQWFLDLPPGVTSWRTSATEASVLAKNYYFWVSLMIFNFLLLRWVWAYALWAMFLLQLARTKLRLNGHHPDRVGGLSFLIFLHAQFTVIPLVISTVMSANLARMVVYGGYDITHFQSAVTAYLFVVLLIMVAPMATFTTLLIEAKRNGLRHFGRFAIRHANLFDARWLTPGKEMENPLGAPDISSLNDLDGSYTGMRNMKTFLLSEKYLAGILLISALPLFPLVLFKVPLAELVKSLAKALSL